MAFIRPGTQLRAQSATVIGSSARQVTGTGAAAAQAAVVSGVATSGVQGTGVLSAQSAIVVSTGGIPPRIVSTPAPIFQDNSQVQQYSMAQHVSDDGVDPLVYTLTPAATAPFSFNTSNGVLTFDGSPGELTRQYQLGVSDPYGSDSSATFNVEVQAVAANVASLQFYDSIVQGDYEGRVRIPLPAEGVGINQGGDFCYEMWLAPSAIAADNPLSTTAGFNYNWIWANIFLDRDLANQFPGHGASLSNGRICFGAANALGNLTLIGVTDLRDGQFHYVVMQRNGTTGVMDIWVDGALEATGTGPTGSLAVPDSHVPNLDCGPGGNESCVNSDPYLVLGTEKHDLQTNGYRGLISEVRVSDTIRRTAPHAVPTVPLAADANTVGLWRWTEGSGPTSVDLSGNNQTAEVRVDVQGPTWELATPYPGTLVTTLSLTNTQGSARNNRVEFFGQPFARGDVAAGQVLQATVDGVPAAVQTNRESRWPDGSLRYAVLSVVSGDFTASQTKTLQLLDGGAPPGGTDITLADLPSDASSNADLTLGAEVITVNRSNLQTPTGTLTQLFTGPHCAAWVYRENYTGVPRVTAAFHIMAFRVADSGPVDSVEYSAGNECVDIRLVEADHGTVASSLHRLRVNGSTVYSETDIMYQYTRWHRWEALPDIHVIHDHAYIDTTGLVPPVRSDFNIVAGALAEYQSGYNTQDGINETRGWRWDMSGGGANEGDIGPVPSWDNNYRLAAAGPDGAAWRDNVWLRSEGGGRHQIHFYDEDESRQVQIGPGAAQHQATGLNPDLGGGGGYWGSYPEAGWTTAGTDLAHQPRFGYTQYLLFGRYFFLEEQQYWGAMCCGSGDGGYNVGGPYNIWHWSQTRGAAWGTLSVACAAVLAPEGDPMRLYFENAMQNNQVEFWDNNYAPGQAGHSICGCDVNRYPPERSGILGQDNWIVSWQSDFRVISDVWAWMMGYDGTDPSLPDYTETSWWLARWPVGRVHKFGAQSTALYWIDVNVAGNSPPGSWDELRMDLYDFNTTDTEAFRGSVANQYNTNRNNAICQQEEPDTDAWRAGFDPTLGATESVGDNFEPGADQAITVAALAFAVMRGAEGAQQAWDRFNALTIATNDGTPSSTEDSPYGDRMTASSQYDLRPVADFPHQTDPLNDWIMSNIGVSSTWFNATGNLGANLQIHTEAQAYSGGALAGSTLAVLGGGHNNGLNDAVALLDFRRFDTQGWYEEIRSTADVAGVADSDYTGIYNYIVNNNLYDSNTPGGIRDERGAVMLSKHTYDCMAPLPDLDGFMVYDGALPYDGVLPGPGSTPWGNIDLCDIWKYRFSQGWEYITQVLVPVGLGVLSSVASLDPVRRRIWINGKRNDNFTQNVFYFEPDTNNVSASLAASGGEEEASGCFNEDDDRFAVGMGFGNSNWNEFDPVAGTWDFNSISGGDFTSGNGGPVPCITYVPARFGANYGAYFGYDVANGTLRRRDPNTGIWSAIATGGPTDSHMYGRFGFEPNHQVFYAVAVVGGAWRTYLVRPYQHNPDEGQ